MQFAKAARPWIVLLAIVSVAAFVFSRSSQPRPAISTSLISPAMNFAYVRVQGVVLGYPTIDAQTGYLSFELRDAGGDLRVSAFRNAAMPLIRDGHIPMPGDRVTVEGTLRVRDEQPSLVMNEAGALQIERPQPQRVHASALDALHDGDVVTTTAQVRRLRALGGGLSVAELRNDDSRFDLLLPLNLGAHFGAPPVIVPGEWLEVAGSVGEFRGGRQLLARRAADVRRLPVAGEFEVRPIPALNPDLVGHWVAVRGPVQSVRAQRLPARITIGDGQGATIEVVMFDAWAVVPFSASLKAGDVIAVQGLLADNRGQFELRPELGFDLALR